MTEADRITKLEETVAHQAHMIDELSDQLAEQWTVTEQMRTRMQALTERFLAFEEQTREAAPITRPPHY